MRPLVLFPCTFPSCNALRWQTSTSLSCSSWLHPGKQMIEMKVIFICFFLPSWSKDELSPQDRTSRAGKRRKMDRKGCKPCWSLWWSAAVILKVTQKRIRHFCLLSFGCLAVVRHSSTHSWQHTHTGLLICHHARAANLCMCLLTSSSDLPHS